MKYLFFLPIFCLIGFTAFAQNTYNFAYKLDYIFPSTEFSPIENFATHYIPEKFTEKTKNSLLSSILYGAGSSMVFLNGNTAISIQNTDLSNNYVIDGSKSDFYYGIDKTVEKLYDKIELKKLDREPMTVLNKTCKHYQLFTSLDNSPQDSQLVFCVDETSEIDNLSFLFPNQEGTKIQGLVLAITSPENMENEKILLNKVSSINSSIQFNLDSELAAHKVRMDSLTTLYNTDVPAVEAPSTDGYTENYDDTFYESYYANYLTAPKFCDYAEFYNLKFENDNAYTAASTYMSNLCNYSYYMKKGEEEKYKTFALKEIKGIKKNLPKTGLISEKDAEMFYDFLKKDIDAMKTEKPLTKEEIIALEANYAAEAAAEAASDYAYEQYVSDYESSYKNLTPESSNFAISGMDVQSNYWKGIPSYCKQIDSIIPKFSNPDLANHAKNYAGQICDMYMGEFDGSSVWYKGTLDAIRSEHLYFTNQRQNLSKSDQKLLDEFLNSLD